MIMMSKQKLSLILIIFFLSFFYLLLGLGYLFSYNPGFFPDEFAHMGYVVDVIKDNFPDYNEGLVFSSNKLNYLNHPPLYYLVVGELTKLLHLQDMFANVGRFINMGISVIIIGLTCWILYRTTKSLLASFLGSSFLLVIPMFVLLGSAVNNDQINVLGCTLVIYGVLGLMENDKDKQPLTSYVICICTGGIIAALSKATGSLAIVCMLVCVAVFNYSRLLQLIKGLSIKQLAIVIASVAVVITYYCSVHTIYGGFYPAPQGTPALWFFIEHPDTKRMAFADFVSYFLNSNLFSLTKPYGYVYMPDSEVRVVVVKTILLMLSLMAGYLSVQKIVKNDPCSRMIFSLIVAFFIFFIIYFFTIRDLHLKTGYTGAMQARYFFGFLPVCCLVIAKVISQRSNEIIKSLIAAVMVAGLSTATYPAGVKLLDLQTWPSMTIIEQPVFNTGYGYLTQGRTFEQSIMAETDTLRGVELMLATFARKNHGPLTLELLDKSGKVIAVQVVSMETLKDNAYAWFDFKQVKVIKNQQYALRLKCDECTPDNAITWSAVKKEFVAPVFLFNEFGPSTDNKYTKGEAYADGARVGGAYSFRLYFG